jgi:hypothetical protein
MIFSRVVLGLIGAIYAYFGAWALISPGDITAMTEVQLTTPTAVTDGRAVYGGLTLGLGFAFLLGAAKLMEVRSAVIVLFLTLLFPVIGRFIGIFYDNGGTDATFAMMRGEVLFMTLGAFALFFEVRGTRLRAAASSPPG